MRFAKQLAAAAALLVTSAASMAHEAHGLAGSSHWHATDTAGFAVVALLATLAIWLSRGE
jgi:hypothetical protein